MRKDWAAVIALAIAGCQSVPPRATASLVEAQLVDVRDVTGQPGSPSVCTLGGDVCLDGAHRLTFRVERNLAGPPVDEELSIVQRSAKPIVGVKYLLVVQQAKNGREIVWSDPAEFGLCIEPDQAEYYRLSAELVRFPCRTD